jgi:hypothetical protein
MQSAALPLSDKLQKELKATIPYNNQFEYHLSHAASNDHLCSIPEVYNKLASDADASEESRKFSNVAARSNKSKCCHNLYQPKQSATESNATDLETNVYSNCGEKYINDGTDIARNDRIFNRLDFTALAKYTSHIDIQFTAGIISYVTEMASLYIRPIPTAVDHASNTKEYNCVLVGEGFQHVKIRDSSAIGNSKR